MQHNVAVTGPRCEIVPAEIIVFTTSRTRAERLVQKYNQSSHRDSYVHNRGCCWVFTIRGGNPLLNRVIFDSQYSSSIKSCKQFRGMPAEIREKLGTMPSLVTPEFSHPVSRTYGVHFLEDNCRE